MSHLNAQSVRPDELQSSSSSSRSNNSNSNSGRRSALSQLSVSLSALSLSLSLSLFMASLVFLLFLLYEAASGSVVIPVVPVKPGQNATLQCDAGDGIIRAVEWTRSDLVDPEYVLSYSKDGSDTTFQHSSFKGRVQLVDGEMKNGDVSLILKNVSREDDGTYECRLATAGSGRKKRAISDSEPISRVRLQVTEDQNGDNKEGKSTPLHVGLGVAAGVLVCLAAAVVVGLLVMKSKRQRDKKPEPSAAEETGGENLL